MIKLLNAYDTRHAVHFLYQLLEEREPQESISHTTMPSREAHAQFVASQPYRVWSIIQAIGPQQQEWVGAVLLTNNNEIGVSIASAHRRQGYARQAIREVITNHSPLPADASKRPGQFVANINPANAASIALFTGLGAVHIQNTYRL